MLHILCKRCKGWIPRKRGRYAYTFSLFKTRINNDGLKQIQCFCGRWTHDPRMAKFIGTKEQIDKILEKNKKLNKKLIEN